MNTALCAVALICLAFSLAGCDTDNSAEHLRQAQASIAEADRQYNLGDVAKGRDWLKKAVALSKADEVFFGGSSGQLGVIAVASNHGDYEALASMLIDASKDPKLASGPDIYQFTGDALFRLGRTTEAKAAYARNLAVLLKTYPSLTARTPSGRPVQLNKAEAEWKTGDYISAKKDFDTVRRLYPDFVADASNSEAYFAAEDGVFLTDAEKLALAAVAVASKTDDPMVLAEFQDTLGWVYYKMWLADHSKEHIDNAVTYLELASSGFPSEPDIHSHLAQAYLAAGRQADAAIEYSRLANMWPADRTVKATADRLAGETTGAPPVKSKA